VIKLGGGQSRGTSFRSRAKPRFSREEGGKGRTKQVFAVKRKKPMREDAGGKPHTKDHPSSSSEKKRKGGDPFQSQSREILGTRQSLRYQKTPPSNARREHTQPQNR